MPGTSVLSKKIVVESNITIFGELVVVERGEAKALIDRKRILTRNFESRHLFLKTFYFVLGYSLLTML